MAGRRRVFSRRRPPESKRRDDAMPWRRALADPFHRQGTFCPPSAQRPQGQESRRTRPDRYAVQPNVAVKQFTAYDPVAKWTIGKVATSAPTQSATSLLITEAPFEVRGIQVDGGASSDPSLSRMPSARPGTLHSTAQTARPQRLRRARPIDMAIRVLRHLRPVLRHLRPASPRQSAPAEPGQALDHLGELGQKLATALSLSILLLVGSRMSVKRNCTKSGVKPVAASTPTQSLLAALHSRLAP
jgi:hypothetical protein